MTQTDNSAEAGVAREQAAAKVSEQARALVSAVMDGSFGCAAWSEDDEQTYREVFDASAKAGTALYEYIATLEGALARIANEALSSLPVPEGRTDE